MTSAHFNIGLLEFNIHFTILVVARCKWKWKSRLIDALRINYNNRIIPQFCTSLTRCSPQRVCGRHPDQTKHSEAEQQQDIWEGAVLCAKIYSRVAKVWFHGCMIHIFLLASCREFSSRNCFLICIQGFSAGLSYIVWDFFFLKFVAFIFFLFKSSMVIICNYMHYDFNEDP